MSDNGHCLRRGATYTDDDFGTDGDGHLIEIHVCDRRALDRVGQTHPRYEHKAPNLKNCAYCGQWMRAVGSQRYHRHCAAPARAEYDAARHRERKAS